MQELQSLARYLYRLFLALFLLVGVIFAVVFFYKSPPEELLEAPLEQLVEEWQPKEPALELATMPRMVKEGYYLITETFRLMGPSSENEADRYSGNQMACSNCHLKAGAQAGSGSWVGVMERFPQFGGRSNRVGTIEDRINGCMERSMNGKMLPVDSDKMKAIVAYMDWLGAGLPANQGKEYQGYPSIKIPDVAVDLGKGNQVYERECIICHGANGQGIKKQDGAGYTYPPLWGQDSYNDGAGMNRVITAAEFIKSNMPYLQATWDNPKLTDEEAFNVAGYINSFPRALKQNSQNDYPNKQLKPVSTPYGPCADDFTPEQHKYGPFPPMFAYYRERYGIIKTK